MSEKITFKDLVEQIAEQAGQSHSHVNKFMHDLVGVIEEGMRTEGSVSISGFGKFELRWMDERTGVNPQTGDEITIPAQNKVIFKPYKNLRTRVNRPYANMESRVLQTKTDSSESIPSENDTDLVTEREIPKNIQQKYTTQSTGDLTDSETDKTDLTGISSSNKPAADKYRLPKEIDKKSSYKWSYAAATIVILLAIILIMFSISDEDSATDIETDQTEQVTELEESVKQNDTNQAAPINESEPGNEPPQEFESYTINQGDSLWSIAEEELGNPYLWPWIYQINENQVDDPNTLFSGIDLKIPLIDTPDQLDPDQRQQVALGYFSLYEWSQQHNPDEAKNFLWAVGVFSPEMLEQAPPNVDPGDLAFARRR